MKTFESFLINISPIKILNLFDFFLTNSTDFYNIYTNQQNQNQYLLFKDENETIQIFSISDYSQINKSELLFKLSGASSLSEALTFIRRFDGFTAKDNNSNLKNSISLNELLKHHANLVEIKEGPPIFFTEQFKRKFFKAYDDYFCIPLFSYNSSNDSSNRIVNFYYWKDDNVRYMNNDTSGINATTILKTEKYLLLIANPISWISFTSNHFSPDFFQIFCHNEASIDVFNTIFEIFIKRAFSQFYLILSNKPNDNKFFARALSFLLNVYSEDFVYNIEFQGQGFSIHIFSKNIREQNIELAKVFGDLNFDLRQSFFSGQENEIEDEDFFEKIYSIKSTKIKNGERVISMEKISWIPTISAAFFNTILKNLKLDSKIKVLQV